MKGVLIGAITFVVIILIVVAVMDHQRSPTSPMPQPSSPPAASSPIDTSKAITLVQDSMTAVSPDTIYAWEYEAGVLEGGVAVLVNNNGAYWVKENVVYAANGIASGWSPKLEYAPTGIDLDTVQDSVT